jgi:hypothetical protein
MGLGNAAVHGLTLQVIVWLLKLQKIPQTKNFRQFRKKLKSALESLGASWLAPSSMAVMRFALRNIWFFADSNYPSSKPSFARPGIPGIHSPKNLLR